MKKANDVIEDMCRRYWNAYRDGFLSVGGSADYPTWDEFNETKAKDETRRCMRHAVEPLIARHDGVAEFFPGKPMRRKAFERLQAEIQAEALNMRAQ